MCVCVLYRSYATCGLLILANPQRVAMIMTNITAYRPFCSCSTFTLSSHQHLCPHTAGVSSLNTHPARVGAAPHSVPPVTEANTWPLLTGAQMVLHIYIQERRKHSRGFLSVKYFAFDDFLSRDLTVFL